MAFLDGRHRWEVAERQGARITHRCRACGRIEVYTTLIPDGLVDMLIDTLMQPNPYRRITITTALTAIP